MNLIQLMYHVIFFTDGILAIKPEQSLFIGATAQQYKSLKSDELIELINVYGSEQMSRDSLREIVNRFFDTKK